MRSRILPWAAALLVASCGGHFEPSSRIAKLRVLAVQSDRPFAQRGETVTLDVLAHDPAGRPVSYGYSLCRNPTSSSVLECLAASDAAPLAVAAGARVSFAIPDVAALGLVVTACPGTLRHVPEAPFKFICEVGGRSLPLEEFELGIKRIFLRQRDRNENPRIERVLWDGAEWPEGEVRDVDRCGEGTDTFDDCPSELSHRVHAITSAPETGIDEAGTRFEERTIVQHYATDGIFEHEVRFASAGETRWVARKAAPPEVRFWFVARDDRGGVSWAERTVRVR